MRFFKIDSEKNWPCGVSDGLNLPCAICGKKEFQFDYNVTDELWNEIVPKEIKRDVVCLSCLDKLATKKGADLASNINFLQFVGINMTIEFVPFNIFLFSKRAKAGGEQ